MSTNIYTYPFPGADTYVGAAVVSAGSDLFPADTQWPLDTLEPGSPPVYEAALYPGLTILWATVEDPLDPVKHDAPPEFTIYVANTRTGKINFELGYEKFSWTCPLNGAGTMSVTSSVDDVYAYDDPFDERASRNKLREIAGGPWRFSFALAFGGNVVWAGPLVAVKLSGDSEGTVEFGCVELWDLFSKRLLVAPDAVSPTDATADTTYQGTTLGNIAKELVVQATTGDGFELPIDFPTVETAGGHQRFYYGYDLANYAERLDQLTKVIEGPDIRFDPYLVTTQDGNYLRWSMTIGNPYFTTADPYTWEHNVNASIEYDLDSKDMAFTYLTTGAGQDRDKKIGSAEDLSLLDVGFPMLEGVDTTHASASEAATLAQWASGDIDAYAKPIETWTINVNADDDPRLGQYRVGDTGQVGIRDHLLIPDGFFTRRIVNMSGDDSGKVSLAGDSKPDEVTNEADVDILGATESTEATVTVAQSSVPSAVWNTLLAWGYTPANAAVTVTRSTLAAAYQYQSLLTGA